MTQLCQSFDYQVNIKIKRTIEYKQLLGKYKKMKKALFLFPKSYTLLDNFKSIFQHAGYEVLNIDYADFFSPSEKKIHHYLLKMPWNIRWAVLEKINKTVNIRYKEIFEEQKPDIVFTYNDQKLVKDTVAYFNEKSTTAFFLGDNPLFIKNRPDNLAAILEGNHIFSPDSYWLTQLKILGAESVHFLIPGYAKKLNYEKAISNEDVKKWGADIVFIGNQYHDTWGYKRALFANLFVGQNFKVYGDLAWTKWFRYFPDLEKHFTLNQTYLPFETVNTILNASKVYPIDANSGLINGLHTRIFETIGSGVLPLVEYRKDLETVFDGVEIPVIHNYNQAKNLAIEYINKDEKRSQLIQNLQKFIDQKYTDAEVGKQIFNKL
ncbi:MAG: hypothetical protein A2W98_01235 [Bacteroidetes bacterium GWF2_33_38]|nr:MAG: hypothetical protein A2W98_01235 [Bacteroidetes bacterium GWF2_33_38]HBX50582.1 hypothetical protein [Bacteroidales bacterium]